MNAHAEIVRRRVKFDFAASPVRRWSHLSPDFENILNAISFLFPAGEKFFINSVRNYQNEITDPVLKDEVDRFIFQEAMHTREHQRSNAALREVLPYGDEMERIAEVCMGLARRYTPRAMQLATSCAMEHFTAMLADDLLRNQDLIVAECDPAFASLWLWHAVEETEHKAVCFDVYESVCGKGFVAWLHRVIVMASTTFLMGIAIGVGFGIIKWKQRKARRGQTVAAKVATDATAAPSGSPNLFYLVKTGALRMYLDYYRRSFHPWNHENSELITKWKSYYATLGTGAEPAREATA